MEKPLLVCPRPSATPSDLAPWRSHIRTIPDDLLREASSRLAIMALLGAVLWFVATVLFHFAVKAMSLANVPTLVTDAIAAISVVLSLSLFFYIRRTDRDPGFILNLGQVYLIYTGLAIGLVFHWYGPPTKTHVEPMITWIGVVVLISAAIVPNSPKKTFVVGLIAVSMHPAGMLIAKARGVWDFGPLSNVMLMHYPDYLLVGVSVVISLVVTRLGHQVSKARAMGSYQLVSMLGKGGMGEVWRARHRMLARDAAIKLIQPDILSRDSGKNADMMRRRFEQEAQTTASLQSPHTVALYDYGVTEEGVFYYVMELLNGIDLESLVKKFGPLPPARVVHILRQVCRSLGEAHRRGLIHRDIKPTNIVLCRMGNEYDFVKVLDFGLVKVTDRGEAEMTMAGAMMGTPAHMAPELALGKSKIDGRTDLYGLGCVGYWLITGRPVFEQKGSAAMMLAHLNDVPIRPAARNGVSVPASVDRMIMMCLEKEPSKRPASADALGRMLADSADMGSWNGDDAERWWRSNVPEDASRLEVPAAPADTSPSAFSTVD